MSNIQYDLFSDTNVNPSDAMRQMISKATVGNEAAGEDPTVNLLLARVCELLGKPAAVFMPTGTMCNGVAYRTLCQPGDRIIIEKSAHPLNMASGMIGGLVGAQPQIIEGIRGIFSVDQLKQAIGLNSGYNIAKATVVSIEQTTNLGGGAIWSLEAINNICEYAHQNGLKVHMDGSRLLNACTATGIKASSYCEHIDSVWIDFAKGLGAPMGSVLAGSKAFIDKAWFYKFQQGGVMHQAGLMAAGCIYALDHHIHRLGEDHANAHYFAECLAKHDDIEVMPVETNIVIFTLKSNAFDAYQLQQILLQKGIRLLALNHRQLRAIFHMDIQRNSIDNIVEMIIDSLTE
ncbi:MULTISPECIES: threonine aldolase family protein [Cysteiniphilum]|uniref:Threonine aldolase n=3 Tax=Cysteiniphilum litorale TaxID=2056700 RepID=A0A8J2Z334_9GAMM|nr:MULTISPECIES: threonine aldolase family protein [Cysteiniphilum]GGF92228.1 threonine aldolase [Cysteiniphilum litorale]